MRQTDYRRRNTALTEEILEDIQKASQTELNWLFRQIRYKVRRLDRQRTKVITGSPRLQKSYIVNGDLWELFIERMRRSLTEAIVRGAVMLHELQRANFVAYEPVKLEPKAFAKVIEPIIGERIVAISVTIKRLVGVKVIGWYNSPGTTMQSLVDQLKPTFGEKRARLIAQTEVTRLNSEVKRLTAEQIGATEWWWSTRRDNLVCKKPLEGPDGKTYDGCRGLHGKTFDIGLPMPPDGSHPGCRCDPVIVPPPPRRTATAQTRPVIEGLLMQKVDFVETEHPRDEDGKFTDKGTGVSGGGQESKRFEWTRDPEVTMEQSLSYLKDYVDNKMPDHLKGKSAAKHIEVFDNPEDVYTRLEELGIAPDIGDDGVVRGAYDFESHTIYTSLWDGYRNSEKNFLHEFGHSIFGEDEDKIEAFVEDYYNEPDDRSNEEGGQEPSSDVVLGESLRFKVHDDSGELPEAQFIPYYTNREEVERDFAKHEQNYAKKLTSEEKYALVEYTDVGADWNDLLRGGGGIEPGDELPEESIRLLDAALEKASFPKRASVTRWLSVENPAFEQLEQLKGKIIQDAGFLSTSLESGSYKPMMEHLMEGSLLPGQSEEEYGMSCVNMRINIPKGAHAGLLQGVGEVWSSSEVLLQRNAKLRVRDVYEITNENYKIGKFPTKQIVLDLIP